MAGIVFIFTEMGFRGRQNRNAKGFKWSRAKNKILFYLNSLNVRFPELVIASTTNKLSASGKTLGQIAKAMETTSEEALLELIQNGGNEILVFEKT